MLSKVFVCKKNFVLPSDPPAQVVQHVHFQGAGTDVRCLPRKHEVDLDAPYCWYIDVTHQVVRSCNSANKWNQFVPVSFNKNIYMGKYCIVYCSHSSLLWVAQKCSKGAACINACGGLAGES